MSLLEASLLKTVMDSDTDAESAMGHSVQLCSYVNVSTNLTQPCRIKARQ